MKFLILLAFVLTFPSILNAQDYDEAFLESLPEEIKADLLGRVDERDALEAPVYRSSYVMKPEEEIDEDLFGHKIFSMMQTTLMPLNEPNFDSEYTLDFGDVLKLQLIGQKSLVSDLKIERDGSVNVPEIGRIFISGLSLGTASDLIQSKIEDSFIGVKAFLTLTSVRDIQVVVAGNVFSPGPYVLNGNSNIFHALTVSGGPSLGGSFRKIDLIRNNQVVESIDLYDTFIYGKESFGKRLKSGDIVFIHPVQNLISVFGSVKRPSRYELKSDEDMADALFFANGLGPYADKKNINIYRVNSDAIEKIAIENLEELDNIKAFDEDRLVFGTNKFNKIRILGAVQNPGEYLVKQGDGVLEGIKRAGGYTQNAYPFGGILENEQTAEINAMAAEMLYKTFLDTLSVVATTPESSSTTLDSILALMSEIKDVEPNGRISAEFDLIKLSQDSTSNIILQDGDTITIPEKVNHIYIYGEVSNEGTVKYQANKSIEFFIEQKGGLNSFADRKNIYVLQPNGKTVKINKNVFMGRNEIELYPGSVIFVPRKFNDRFLVTKSAQAYATILGNIGVSLASISVLKD